MPRNVLLASTDLFFSTRIVETARQVGASITQVRGGAGEEASRLAPDLVLVDLSATAFDPVAAIAEVRAASPGAQIVAFVRHEETETIRSAREAGADDVFARGAFSARLPSLLAGPERG